MFTEPLKELQRLASRVAGQLAPGEQPARVRVVVYGVTGGRLFDLALPCLTNIVEAAPITESGWSVRENAVYFNGDALPIRGRNLDVLRVLIEKDVATVENLRVAWDGYKAEDSTIRWQVGELKKVLKKQFPDFEGDVIEGTGNGYRLLIR